MTRRAAIGVSAHLGWAACAAIRPDGAGLRVLRSEHLEIAKPEDREAREPYHVAGGFEGLSRVPRPANAERALEKGLRRQRRGAVRALSALAAVLEADGHRLAVAALLVGRGRAAATFEKAVGSHTQIHVEEGLAVRESLRLALESLGCRVVTLDQKTLFDEARAELGRSEAALRAELRAGRPEAGGPWRKEEQSAALAAWMAWRRREDRA